ncbi:hypothetical protein EVJ58_g3163 [Rhodofomes roseus]|uniref:Integrase catalytic domain-containing protein n=1 Tax=Rhodofomes roseus TaxID=34475 RepID=A0A4Y9YM89_9APHY|nr:hypothetical protein EVJ58_g3163 [Rhodofomes roseus]
MYNLPHKLSPSNYLVWSTLMEATLETVELFEYCTGAVPQPIRAILNANMTEEVLAQIGYLKNAASIWAEARRLYAGQSSTDWTMTITNLVTTRYADGQDLLAHIAKMKGFRRDLILMNRDIDDELYACFLRISMPTSWNYVFAGLPDRYSSQEVERRLKDEHGIRANQQTQSRSYRAGDGKQSFGKKKRKGRGGNGSQNGESTPHAGSSPGKANSGSDSATQTSTAQTSENKQNRGASSGKQPHCPYRPYTQQQQCLPRANQAIDDAASVSDAGHDSSYLAAGPIPHSRFTWILDGGSTTHICNDRSAFRLLCETRGTIGSIQKTGPQLQVLGRGEIHIICRVDGRDKRTVTLKDVAYCPDARDNLISESRMDHHGLEIRKRNGTVAILKPNGDVAMQGTLRYNLYKLDCAIAPPGSHPSDVAFSAKSDTSNINLWHCRLGHLNERSIRHLAKSLASTLLCRARLGRVVAVLMGSMRGPFLPSILGYTYTLAVVDDASRKGWKEYLKHKSDATDEIKALVTRLETLTGKKLKYLRTDGGGEFINRILGEWLREKGITHEYSTPDTPQQNGVAERFNRTTHEHALCMLHEAGMKPGFWPEAHEYASYVRNMSPTSALDGMTPDEAFSGTKPNVSTLRIFGSPCHVRILPKDRSKLDAHSLDGRFCGFARNQKAYKIWVPSKHTFVSSRDVIIYEQISTASIGGVSPGTDTRSDVDPLIKSTSSLPAASSTPAAQTEPRSSPTTSTTSPSPSAMSSPDPPLRRSTRVSPPSWKKQAAEIQKAREQAAKLQSKAVREVRAERQKLKVTAQVAPEPDGAVVEPNPESEVAHLAYRAVDGEETPRNYSHAMKSRKREYWLDAMGVEMDMHWRRGTWELVELPPGQHAIGSTWTYALKRGPDGSIQRYKARLVAQGFSQIPGLDYDDTFSPTVRLDTLRVILHLAAVHGWCRAQDDVTGAFLHSKLHHVVYMRQPPGFDDGTGRVCRLLLSLYGLKQASREWNKLMTAKLRTVNLLPLDADAAVFMRRAADNGVFSIIAVHVDNMLSFSENPDELARIRHHLHDLFEMKEEDANWLMGFEIIDYPDSHTVAISHRQYIETVIKRFRMDGCTPVSTPMEKGLILDKYEGPFTPEEEERMRRTPYRALIGALTWISLISRPDIAFATTYLAQFNSNPGPEHWEAAQRILAYLAGTLDHVLLLGGEGEDVTRLIGWSDADHGRDIVDRRSVSAYVWQIGNASVSWSSKKQQTVAISSTESEYMAMTHSSKHGIWLRRLLIELNELVSESEIATPIFVDNKSSIDLSKEARFHARTKHIDVQHHFIRERVEDGTFVVMHVPSHLNIADGLTKPLDRVSFEIFVDALGLVS